MSLIYEALTGDCRKCFTARSSAQMALSDAKSCDFERANRPIPWRRAGSRGRRVRAECDRASGARGCGAEARRGRERWRAEMRARRQCCRRDITRARDLVHLEFAAGHRDAASDSDMSSMVTIRLKNFAMPRPFERVGQFLARASCEERQFRALRPLLQKSRGDEPFFALAHFRDAPSPQ